MAETVAHIIGARPNFMKAAPVIGALDRLGCRQTVVHTGQHYDDRMSDVFFRDLDLRPPDLNLGVGSGSHARQTAAIMIALEDALDELRPGLVLLYGDVNSTVAGALVATKLGLASGHVEAGLRSFDRSMPEEVNRVVTDALADLLFATSPEAIGNLGREGIDPGRVHLVGNPMIDTLLRHLDRLDPEPIRSKIGVGDRYAVVTLHRPSNVDEADSARRVVDALNGLSQLVDVVLPLHPRGRPTLEGAGLRSGDRLKVVEPLGYLDFIALVRGAALVVTDSGGIQEETTILGVACLTVRPNTERPITISHGTNRLVAPEEVVAAAPTVRAAAVVGRPGGRADRDDRGRLARRKELIRWPTGSSSTSAR
jgi:UDP-N-acetylglucosamine 2-epimerase (non-hydrolysing)